MFKFFLKKNLADGWDNFFFIILSNVIQVAILAGSWFAIGFAENFGPLVQAAAMAVCSGILFITVFAWGSCAAKIADFRAAGFSQFFGAIRHVALTGFAFGALLAVFIMVIRFGISFYVTSYFRNGSIIQLILAVVLIFFAFVSFMSLQWFVPLYYLQDSNGFVKCLKKSYIIFFDNASFCVKMFVYNALLLVLSIIVVGLVPGLNGITLSNMNALRILLYKYDWYEKMSESDPEFINDRDRRSEVPWEELIAQDKEMLGPRKLSSFLFPWK